ncbi:hypothetical protein OSB04_012441 [Centaurea solstitialis]|uniref:U1-type domain-containing protein n=1 Tax=Centaurea solstitialis TaxID=347529 RepID=A0AA38WDZ3_9ASTR|nr:hypothetical protein OSB04_012441 [Centaurea solstitialis]
MNLGRLDTQMQPNQQLVIQEGLWSMEGGCVVIREAIERELEKERIREEILAEELARKRVLEAEVRREISMEMAMYGGRGFPLLGSSPIIHNDRFDPRGSQSATQKPDVEIGGVEVVPFRRLIRSPEGKQKVIHLGEANSATVHEAKGKAEGPKEWSCAVCRISATSEQGLNDHLVGKKHKAKMAKAHDSAEIGMPSKRKKSEEKEAKRCDSKSEANVFWCEMCDVGPCSEIIMEAHRRGKKHMKKLRTGTKRENEKAESGPKTEVADSEWIGRYL